MASPALAAFTVGIGFEADEQSARRTANSFDMLKKKALSLGSVLAGAFGFKGLTTGVAGAVDQLTKLSHRLGISATDLSSWRSIVMRAGGTEGEADQFLQGLQGMVANLELDDGAMMQAFARAKVDPNILMAQQDPLKTASMLSRVYAANADNPLVMRKLNDLLGASGSVGDALTAGPGGLAKQMKDEAALLSISKELSESSAEFNDQMHTLSQNFSALAYTLSEELLPPVNAIIEAINNGFKWFRSDEDRDPITGLSTGKSIGGVNIPSGAMNAFSAAPQGTTGQPGMVPAFGDLYVDGVNLGKLMIKSLETYNSKLGPVTATGGQ